MNVMEEWITMFNIMDSPTQVSSIMNVTLTITEFLERNNFYTITNNSNYKNNLIGVGIKSKMERFKKNIPEKTYSNKTCSDK